MLDFSEEKNIFNEGYRIIGAIDEAGRGPLAGPVVAACVIVEPDFTVKGKLKEVKDSKKLTPKKRELLCEEIKNELSFGIGICDHSIIDKINILEASFLAMKKALGALKNKPDIIILDGKFKISNCSYTQKPIPKGDNFVFSIAAASIIAKVARDKMMREIHNLYPKYCFDRHKGYGTKLHLELLNKYGPCPIHRKSFRPVRDALQKR